MELGLKTWLRLDIWFRCAEVRRSRQRLKKNVPRSCSRSNLCRHIWAFVDFLTQPFLFDCMAWHRPWTFGLVLGVAKLGRLCQETKWWLYSLYSLQRTMWNTWIRRKSLSACDARMKLRRSSWLARAAALSVIPNEKIAPKCTKASEKLERVLGVFDLCQWDTRILRQFCLLQLPHGCRPHHEGEKQTLESRDTSTSEPNFRYFSWEQKLLGECQQHDKITFGSSKDQIDNPFDSYSAKGLWWELSLRWTCGVVAGKSCWWLRIRVGVRDVLTRPAGKR